ncbi:MAG: hypothetical protein Kow0069_26900 [Promethearchaeota archaeon]
MRREQRRTTARVLELFADPHLERPRPIEAGSLVLDAGCGSGFSLEVLEATGATCVGLDRSTDMLRLAKRTSPDRHLVRADLSALPLRTGAFSHVASVSTLNFIAENATSQRLIEEAYLRAYFELARVLRPGGAVVAEYYPRDEREMEASSRAATLAGLRGFHVIDGRGTRKQQTFLVAATNSTLDGHRPSKT